jgi:hypothetical protein
MTEQIIPPEVFVEIIQHLDQNDVETLRNLRQVCHGAFSACEYVSQKSLDEYKQTKFYVWKEVGDGWGGCYSARWRVTSWKPTQEDTDRLENSRPQIFLMSRQDILNNRPRLDSDKCDCAECEDLRRLNEIHGI